MKWVLANWDKPHRCPECHRISDEFRQSDRRYPWLIGTCPDCGVKWSYLQARLRLLLYRLGWKG